MNPGTVLLLITGTCTRIRMATKTKQSAVVRIVYNYTYGAFIERLFIRPERYMYTIGVLMKARIAGSRACSSRTQARYEMKYSNNQE